jgi:hypothetical protein
MRGMTTSDSVLSVKLSRLARVRTCYIRIIRLTAQLNRLRSGDLEVGFGKVVWRCLFLSRVAPPHGQTDSMPNH